MIGRRTTYYPAVPLLLAPDFTAFRDRVAADQGGIANAQACQAALAQLAQLGGVVQWLDARFGVRSDVGAMRWYSICGPQVDVQGGGYGTGVLGVDTTLGSQVWSGGAWVGSSTPRLELGDDYTWGMRVFLKPAASGVLWGDFLADGRGWWTYMLVDFWRSYDGGVDDSFSFALPRDQWFWLWCVKQGNQLIIYVDNVELARLTLTHPIYEKTMGIAGGSDSFGVCNADTRYQTFVRLVYAASASQRAAIMAV